MEGTTLENSPPMAEQDQNCLEREWRGGKYQQNMRAILVSV